MRTEILCAGFGGQGVLTSGMLLIHAAMKQGYEVLYYPSYGSEMRGGTANCSVKICDGAIASPVIREADILIALNTPAIDRFEPRLKKNGLLLVNASLTSDSRPYRGDVSVMRIPVTDLANTCANPRGANIAMLGALSVCWNIMSPDALLAGIDDYFLSRGKQEPKNALCFMAGRQFASDLTAKPYRA